MATEIIVPMLGESVTTATIARWMKQQGEAVAADEPLVELETDKVTVEVNAPAAGVLASIGVPEGAEVEVGAVLGVVDAAGATAVPAKAAPPPKVEASPAPDAPQPRALEPRLVANPPVGVHPPPKPPGPVSRPAAMPGHAPFPSAAKLMEE
ncbi:MAG: dihydrolipoamide succinyltransferase, partial [Rhodospirillales bacterium]|nr:dihydrolipoamide succinyltransferase [Acetobacter sp.]